MLVLENPEQGINKSTALSILAVREEWFSDDLPLNADPKRVIESLRGRWIVEAAELSGMRRADVEHLKAFLSRQIDRARLSYDRLITERPRQCVIAGTTNSKEYLRDTTGNRRMWPVAVRGFDAETLRRDRDQLWAEAAAREARGDSIRLDPSLWEAAGREQAERLTQDPYYEALAHELGGFEGGLKVASADIWTILDVRAGQRSQDQNSRVGDAMRKLGWRRPNKGGTVRVGGKLVSGYVRGEQPWRAVNVRRRYDKETGEHWLEVWCADEDRPEGSIPPWESDEPPF
jgi:predicted P-loop ATPase